MIKAEPDVLSWNRGDNLSKTITFTNIGPDDLWLTVKPPAVILDNRYFWGPIDDVLITAKRKAGATQKVTLTVSPPLDSYQVLTVDIPYQYRDASGRITAAVIFCNNDAPPDPKTGEPPKAGDLWLVGLAFNPPDTDQEAQGEYIDIQNRSQRLIKLDGCTLHHMTYSHPTSHGHQKLLHTLKGVLEPSSTLRVHTGIGVSTDPLLLYLNRKQPVWNNDGDVVHLKDAYQSTLFVYGYGREEAETVSEYAELVLSEPPQLPPIMVLSVRVGATASAGQDWSISRFDIQDGDKIVIETEEDSLRDAYVQTKIMPNGTIKNDYTTTARYLPSGCGLNNGIIYPSVPAPENCPCPGDPALSLLMKTTIEKPGGAIRDWFELIGSGFEKTLSLDDPAKLSLSFGINDSALNDNSGYFDIVVKIFRP